MFCRCNKCNDCREIIFFLLFVSGPGLGHECGGVKPVNWSIVHATGPGDACQLEPPHSTPVCVDVAYPVKVVFFF